MVMQTEERFLPSDVFESRSRTQPPRNGTGCIREAARDVPVYHDCDVLVVGGGPSGSAAAYAAAKVGADVVLLERYNHLGGLSTGGLVIWIDRMTDWAGRQVIRGFADDILDRLPAEGKAGPAPEDWGSRDPKLAAYWGARTSAFHGIVSWAPTIDPERLKVCDAGNAAGGACASFCTAGRRCRWSKPGASTPCCSSARPAGRPCAQR
jgi:hypothetical protein